MKTKTISLRAHGSTMYLYAIRKGDAGTSYVTVTDANKQTQRGLTEQHATFDEAVARIARLAEDASRLGWERPSLRRFAAKPDAFAALPKPPAAKKGGR